MKKIIILLTVILFTTATISAIPPYYKLEVRTGTIGTMSETVRTMLTNAGFDLLGGYYVADSDYLYVITFTSDELKSLASSVQDRGVLGAVMKVGITLFDGKVTVSLLNPEYIFYAYFRDKMGDSSFKSRALNLSNEILKAVTFETTTPSGFGGDISAEDLVKYRYMAGMPRFTAPVELRTFDSFEQGVEIIRKNLDAEKGRTVKVYELVLEDKEVALFGVGLYDQAKGEEKFIPIIGEDNLAAMPYEIILQGNQATMLHGRFRFALHWPELKMTTFTKIMSSPGDVEDFMKGLVFE